MTRSFFSKSVSLCLWAVSSFVSIFRLHLEVTSYDTSLSLSLLLHLEWSSLLAFLTLGLAFVPSSLWLRCIPLCTCAPLCVPSPMLLQLTCFSVLAVVHSRAKVAGLPISIKFWLSQPWCLNPGWARHETQACWGSRMREQPKPGSREGISQALLFCSSALVSCLCCVGG